MTMTGKGEKTPSALRDASGAALTGAVGRARTRRASRRNTSALPAPTAEQVLARPAPAPAKRARSSLPPLPYGTRVSRHGKRPVEPVQNDNSDNDDDESAKSSDDEDAWEDLQECDATAAAAVSASLAAAEKEAEARSAAAEQKGGTAEERAAARKSAAKAEAKRKRLATRLQNVQLLNKYKVHIVLMCAMQLRMDDAANDPILQALALSILPSDAVLSQRGNEGLRRFALWFRFTFQSERLVEGASVRRKCSSAERALDCLAKKRGEVLDLVVLAAAAVRATTTRCRIVVPVQPLPFKLPPASARAKNVSGRKVSHVVAEQSKLAGLYAWLEVLVGDRWVHVDPVAGLVDSAKEKDIFQAICPEDPTADSSVDASKSSSKRKQNKQPSSSLPSVRAGRGVTMADLRVRRTARPRAEKPSVSHVLAVENGFLVDVTRRYVEVWQEVCKERPPNGLFEKTIAVCSRQIPKNPSKSDHPGNVPFSEATGSSTPVLSPPCDQDSNGSRAVSRSGMDLENGSPSCEAFTGRAADLDVDVAATREQLEFDRRSMEESVPKTLSAMRNHQLYVIERHLKKYEAIYPKEPILGYVGPGKDPVFLRSHVRMLHTRDRWRRDMRSVKANEMPIKSVGSKSKRDVDGIQLSTESDLFGEWQTEPLSIPPVKDGIVPRTGRGTVELWTPNHMPEGGVHVPLSHAASVARQLGFDCAPCMTGFDIRSGRSVPRIEGVVVAAEYEEVVRDGALAAAERAKDQNFAKAREEALAKWKELFRSMKERQRVQAKYGSSLGDDPATEETKGGKSGERNAGPGGNERTASDPDREAGPVSKRARLGAASADAHEHEFDSFRPHEGDIWIKTCRVCGMEVPYEKL